MLFVWCIARNGSHSCVSEKNMVAVSVKMGVAACLLYECQRISLLTAALCQQWHAECMVTSQWPSHQMSHCPTTCAGSTSRVSWLLWNPLVCLCEELTKARGVSLKSAQCPKWLLSFLLLHPFSIKRYLRLPTRRRLYQSSFRRDSEMGVDRKNWW